MCLDISSHYHRSGGPKTAEFPILVWKGLNKSYDNDSTVWVSPYRYTPYRFGKLYTSEMNKYGDTIEHGLHACLTKTRAEYHSDYETAFPAIIPVGSKFWLSLRVDNEIVSNNLIVFRTMDDVLNHFKVPALAPPVSRNSL